MFVYKLVSIVLLVVMFGCSSEAVIITNPPDARVTLDGEPLVRNVLTYGRWIGNNYHLTIDAPKFKTKELDLSPKLSDRAGGIAFLCVATIVGIPFLPSVFWNGQLDNHIYVSMEPDYEIAPK